MTATLPVEPTTVRTRRRAVRSARRLPLLPVRARKVVLLLHVISSVGWLGLSMANIVLAVTGYTTADPVRQHTAYNALGMLGDLLLTPVSLTAFGTGLVLAFGTRWGLLKHKWVFAKFLLTAVPVVLIQVSLLPTIHDAVAIVAATPAGQLADVADPGSGLVAAAFVSTTMYTTSTALSVFKPRRAKR
ncbi:MAG: hypothetical protein GEV07_25595 [Streptosporangiales bacterium]|nr:hypothetical protein [Streptosporangiales bacterium]